MNQTYYTYTAEFAGYSLLDGWLGNESVSVYKGQSVEEIAREIAETLPNLRDAYFTTEEDAINAREELEGYTKLTIEEFTPLELAELIVEARDE